MANDLIMAFEELGYEPDKVIESYGLPSNPIDLIMAVPIDESYDLTIENGLSKDKELFEAFLAACEYCNWSNIFEETIAEKNGKGKDNDRTIAQQAGNMVQKAGESVREKIKDIKENPKKEAIRPLNWAKNKINPIIDNLKQGIKWFDDLNEEDRRTMVIEGSLFVRLRRLFFKVFAYTKTYPILWAAMPGGFIFILIKIFMALKATKSVWQTFSGTEYNRAKERVIQELELELKMCREKIEDARSDGNRKAKYQLMRLEAQIEKEITRIKYGVGGDGGRSISEVI